MNPHPARRSSTSLPGIPRPRRSLPVFLALSIAAAFLRAQTTEPPQTPGVAGETITLSPFIVAVSSEQGYAARETLAGSRLKTLLKDVPAQISVMTPEFLSDIASVNVDDAFRYSLNVENLTEFQSATLGGGEFAGGVLNIYGTDVNRVRGLVGAGRTHDFFRTYTPGDTYNIETVTFSSGPNSILFGQGAPSGIVDTQFKRANLQRRQYRVSLRVDNEQSLYTMFDLNQPLWKNKAAIRIAGVKSNTNDWRQPAGEDAERLFATVTVQPFTGTTIRGYYEDVFLDRIIAATRRPFDGLTGWITSGRPTFHNGLVNPDPSPNNNADPSFTRNGQTAPVFVFGSATPVPVTAFGSSGSGIPGATTPYSVVTKGLGVQPYQVAPDIGNYTLIDPSISPLDVYVNGNGSRNRVDSEIYGATIEQRIGRNLFIEAGFNHEKVVNPVTDMIRGIHMSIRADANEFLPDRVTPNPNLGRYYVEGNGRARVWLRQVDEKRITASYDLDLTKFSKWLGTHRLAALYQRVDTVEAGQEHVARAVPAGTSFETMRDTWNYPVQFRAYLSDPVNTATGTMYYANFPWDVFDPFILPNGATVYTTNNPVGGSSQELVPHTRLDGVVLAMQNKLLRDRLATSFGWRSDRVRSANSQTPRFGTGSGFQSILTTPQSNDWTTRVDGDTFTGGAVLHVFPWLSVFYNQSSTWNPPLTASHNPDGSVVDGSHGEGEDYGLMLRFLDDRVSFRINRYGNTSGPDVSTFRTLIIPQISDIEETIFDAATAGLIPAYQSYSGGYVAGQQNDFFYEATAIMRSRGYEAELVANPLPNWRITVNAAKSEAQESSIALPWVQMAHDRVSYWAQYPNLQGPSSENQTTTISSRVQTLLGTLNEIEQAEGRMTEQGRGWRANLYTRYTFTTGPVKGLAVGGGYRYRAKGVIGYRAMSIPNSFNFPGIAATFNVRSIDAPIYSDPVHEIEALFGYRRRLWNGKINWNIQLNIRNLFDDQDIVTTRAGTNSQQWSAHVPAPRSFILTNTFEF